jgi:hypothetical protein
MVTITVPGLDKDASMAHVYGNVAYKRKRFTLAAASAVADVVNILRLPARTHIIDFFEHHSQTAGAATTANFGLKAVDGAGTLDDADYFLAAANLNAAGRNRWGNTGVLGVTLDEDYYVQAVLAGANTVTAMVIEVTVLYEFIGNL